MKVSTARIVKRKIELGEASIPQINKIFKFNGDYAERAINVDYLPIDKRLYKHILKRMYEHSEIPQRKEQIRDIYFEKCGELIVYSFSWLKKQDYKFLKAPGITQLNSCKQLAKSQEEIDYIENFIQSYLDYKKEQEDLQILTNSDNNNTCLLDK